MRFSDSLHECAKGQKHIDHSVRVLGAGIRGVWVLGVICVYGVPGPCPH